MQNLWKILQRYSNFLVFITLEVVAFLLIVYNSAYPRSYVLSTANRVVGWQYEKMDEITTYFSLRRINEELATENTILRNQLATREAGKEESINDYLSAKVVQLTTDEMHNYLTINKGKKDGLRYGQGVRNADGVVGIIKTVGEKYSVVIPIIHTQTNLSCRFQKNDYIGTLQWDGKDSRTALLTDVASHIEVDEGDTIITSGLSPVFPEGIPVGIVESKILKDGDSYYTIRVRLQTNFKALKYVEVIRNKDQDELEKILHGLD